MSSEEEEQKKALRTLNILLGATLVVMSIMVVIFSDIALLTLLLIISVAVLIIGLTRLLNGASNKTFDNKTRALKVITGFLAIIFGLLTLILAIVDPAVSIELLIFILAGALLIIGIARFATGLQAKKFPRWFRSLVVIVGILSVILAILIFIFPPIGYLYLIFMLSVALMFNGIARIALGIVHT